MGLDWQPLSKPKPGHEAEFDELYDEIFDLDNKDASLWERLRAIAISPDETLQAPRVGVDAEADRWAAEKYAKRSWKQLLVSRRKWRKIFHGYYVIDLVPPNDGMPRYTNGGPGSYCAAYTFRAKFFDFCEDMLGEELSGEAWVPHRPAELTEYGTRLRDHAAAFAERERVADVLGQRRLPESITDWEHPAAKAHIVNSAARWCLFWGAHGRGMYPDF
jgi:hypothetical protein